MKIIIFKLFEFSSTIFSKSQQLKDINIISLTEGFELNINIFESISNNISHTINYRGNTSTIKICLRKNKLTIGIGQMNIINKRQNIKIYPTNNNPNKKLITLILFCYNKKDFSEKYLESYKSPDKTQYYKYFNNSNNSNTNNTSSFSISSLIIKNNKTPLNKRKIFIINQKNKSQTNLTINSQKKLFTGLTQNSIYSFNNDIFKYDKDHNITIYSDNINTKSQLSGSISCYSNNFFSEKKNKNKKLLSPAIYSYPFNKNKNKNNINENKKRNFQNKSMINSLILSNLDLKIDDENKFTHALNLDKMNKKIDEYIFDKTFEDVLQNDLPIISQEDKQFLYYDEYNSNKYKKMITDFFLLYNEENIKKVNNSEIKLETHFMIEKIYELMHEYYKEYYDFDNQNKYLASVIKNFGYRYNNLLKKKTNLKIKIYKNKIKKDLYPKKKKLKYYIPKVNKINNELKILNNINQITINNNNKIKNLRSLFLNIIQKNKNKINEKQIKKLKEIGITIIEDNYISDQKNNNNLNKKINNKNEEKEVDNKRKKSIDLTLKKYTYSNLNINEKNNHRIFRNYKIKVKSKINNIKVKNININNNVNSEINSKDFPFNKKKIYKNQNI